MKCLAVLVILLFAALPVFADSITVNTFALQANPIRLEALGPGLNPVLAPMVIYGEGRGLVFDTSLGPIGSVVFSSTISLLGVHYTLAPDYDSVFGDVWCGLRISRAGELQDGAGHAVADVERGDGNRKFP